MPRRGGTCAQHVQQLGFMILEVENEDNTDLSEAILHQCGRTESKNVWIHLQLAGSLVEASAISSEKAKYYVQHYHHTA